MSWPSRNLSLLLLAILGCAAIAITAADAGTATAAQILPADARATQQLLSELPKVPEISLQGRRILWQGNGAAATIVGIDAASGDPLLETTLGPLRVARWVVEQHHLAVIPALPGLIARATSVHCSAAALVLQDGLLTGASLRSADTIIVHEGVMRKLNAPADDRAQEIAQVARAIAAVDGDIGRTGLDDLGRQALRYVLAKLSGRDGGQAADDVPPSFARREVRHGWLRRWFHAPADAADVAALEQAVAAVDQQRTVAGFQGDGVELVQERDAFGRGGWIYRSPSTVLVAKTEVPPEFLGFIPELLVVVELPPGADPAQAMGKAMSARIYQGSTLLAQWSDATGFSADAGAWQRMVGAQRGNLAPAAIPPHILISGLDGDIAGLAVAKGLLRPVEDATLPAAQRFISDAASLLPDCAHLDLIGEYLFTYAYPTPEAAHPELIGNPQNKGDVQQTVWQTCATALGGILHGDCADIAELYQVITKAQGRNSFIIGLPEHAACAWADQEGQGWRVDLLQTGPPLSFTGSDLPACLVKTYSSFDPAMAVDANELPLLLCFSGEASRSEWSLSWRIFRDSLYAQAMIEVQRDWHYQTYQRGIATMQRIIAGGDDDNANYRELSGLYAFTGQYDLAADYSRQAIAHTSDPASRLNMSIQLVGDLLHAGKRADAEATASAVLDRELPALRQRLGRAAQQIGLQLAATCLDEDGTIHLLGLAQRTLHEVLQQPLDEAIAQVAGWLAANPSNREVWANSTELRSLRSQIERCCGVIIDLAARCGPERMAHDPELQQLGAAVQRWLDAIAFHDCDDRSAVLVRYASAGSWYAALQGEAAFDRQLEAVPPATERAFLQVERIGGARQEARDLPWIRVSVPYWYGRLARQFSRDHATLDAQQVAHDALRLAEAGTATAALGLSSPGTEMQSDLGVEIAAMIAHDRPALDRILVRIAATKDKQLRDDAAQWIGDAARFLDPAWFAEVLAAWRDDVDYQPKYFWIAWRAALGQAPRQALMAARLAAERFPHDAAFAEEYDYMRALLAPAQPGAGVGADPAVVPVAPPPPPGIIIPASPPLHGDGGISSCRSGGAWTHAASVRGSRHDVMDDPLGGVHAVAEPALRERTAASWRPAIAPTTPPLPIAA